jgi:hypothetical protein
VSGGRHTDAQLQALVGEIATFLVATAMVLRETVVRFEKTTARVTESVAARPDGVDRELIVTLQDFDRLQQEFATLAEVLTQAAAKPGASWVRAEGGNHPAEDAVATVLIADLKERLMQRLGFSAIDALAPPEAEEAVF